MNYKSTTYASNDGIKLSGYLWHPDERPKALINLIHGFGEYSERYDHWAMLFAKKGFVVHAMDNRGHGRSDGRRGHINRFDDFLNDVDVLVQESKKLYPDLPQLIYGHSMGGNIVANYILKRNHDFMGAVISSPWLKLAFDPSALTIFFARIMMRLFPKFTQNAKLDVKGISHEHDIVDKYLNDSLIHEKISARMFFEIHQAGIWAIQNAEKLTIPVLVQHGTGDKITSYKASKEFADRAKKAGKNVLFKEWEGLYHELHNEQEKDQIFDYVLNWIEQKL